MSNVYAVGTKIRLSAAFTDLSDAASDPGGILFKIRAPDGMVTTYTYGSDVALVKDATGNYHVDWLIAASGVHRYGFYGITSGQAVDESSFRAKPSALD